MKVKQSLGENTAWESRLQVVYQALIEEKSLLPGVSVNALFTELVALVQDNYHAQNKESFELIRPSLNILCARGEELLEKYWAGKLLSKDLSWADLEEFPYFKNYQLLADWEFNLIQEYLGKSPGKLLFVGSGSLPLSAILMARNFNVEIECWDMDKEAVEKSQLLIKKLGLENIKVERRDFFEQENFGEFDLVMMAALVGISAVDKQQVLKHLREYLQAGQTFLIRSAEKLKTLFYQPVEEMWLVDFKKVEIFHPRNEQREIINSVILATN